jgi:hypothetical protein
MSLQQPQDPELRSPPIVRRYHRPALGKDSLLQSQLVVVTVPFPEVHNARSSGRTGLHHRLSRSA